ncbi:hypothetical protein TCON_2090 [Astathelohania contejeani]|uniref:Uncharacterized protein n=1 Tax=Astathelohania contejeani TaxID=164912 RepID=A0ABQ7HX56_9MICR|nr:hypothetical protein TCON_2090 [Thelohania contejeani]
MRGSKIYEKLYKFNLSFINSLFQQINQNKQTHTRLIFLERPRPGEVYVLQVGDIKDGYVYTNQEHHKLGSLSITLNYNHQITRITYLDMSYNFYIVHYWSDHMPVEEEKTALKEIYERYKKRNNFLWEEIDTRGYELDIDYLNAKYKEAYSSHNYHK